MEQDVIQSLQKKVEDEELEITLKMLQEERSRGTAYIPTPAEIELEKAKIRSEWNDETELSRRVGPYNQMHEARIPGSDKVPVWETGEAGKTKEALRKVVPADPNDYLSFGRVPNDPTALKLWKKKHDIGDEGS